MGGKHRGGRKSRTFSEQTAAVIEQIGGTGRSAATCPVLRGMHASRMARETTLRRRNFVCATPNQALISSCKLTALILLPIYPRALNGSSSRNPNRQNRANN